MDELTASVGLTRGALYHHFGDKKGLLAAVVKQLCGNGRKADPEAELSKSLRSLSALLNGLLATKQPLN